MAPLARVKHVVKFDFQVFLSFDQLQARINSTKSRPYGNVGAARLTQRSCTTQEWGLA